VNNGNWQWAASTGADAQPYFRIFNPWSQQVRHDPDAAYVREWVEELRGLDAATIHGLAKRRPPGLAYPEPIVRHAVEAREAQERFRRAAGA
jgi:deoxyribodipyrimidine photo-lyase